MKTHTIIRIPDPQPAHTKVELLSGAGIEFYFPHSIKRRKELVALIMSCNHLHHVVILRKSVFVSIILYQELVHHYRGDGVKNTVQQDMHQITRER